MARTIFDMAANTWREQREKIQLGLSFESEFDVPIENKHTLADLIRNVNVVFSFRVYRKGLLKLLVVLREFGWRILLRNRKAKGYQNDEVYSEKSDTT